MKLRWAALAAAILILLCGGWYFLFCGIQDTVTVEAGASVQISDFSDRVGFLLQAQSDLGSIDTSVPGEYPVKLRCLWQKFDSLVIVQDTVPPTGQVRDMTVFCTQIPTAEDFLVSSSDATDLTVSFSRQPDPAGEGTQTVIIRLTDAGGNVTDLEASLTLIFDDTPPTITGPNDQRVYLGTVLDLMEGVTITDDLDPNAILTIDDKELDWNTAGVYPVTYHAVDTCGNESTVTITVTVIEDVTPPQILGVTELSIYVGSTVAYRKGVLLTDDTDAAPRLSVDSSAVDLSKPGTYPVIYTAIDCVGNTSTAQTTITVLEAPSTYVDEADILAAADNLLDKILNEDMTVREQVEAIYRWMDRNCYYVNTSDKSDWMQSAWKLLQTQRGDCFNFYALSRLLFERLGLPNLTVTRLANSWRSGNHWWNMVSLDGGETWYHFDSTPHLSNPVETCLVTDAELEQFNRSARGYYEWDRSAYPATP